jgi:tryptophan-rich sensory protein
MEQDKNWLRAQALSSRWKNLLLRAVASIALVGVCINSQNQYFTDLFTKLRDTLGIPYFKEAAVSVPLPKEVFIVVWSVIYILLANSFIDLFLSRKLTRSRLTLWLSLVLLYSSYPAVSKVFLTLNTLAFFWVSGIFTALGYYYLPINRRMEFSFMFILIWFFFASNLILRSVIVANPGLFPLIFNNLI